MAEFIANPGVKEEVPLLIGLAGPSGSGKTYTALTLATGIASVKEGPIVVIDTENRRALHYAEDFEFLHMPFKPPFRSLRYKAAIEAAEKLNPSCIIIDSMSHEHEGEGGLNDYHAEELEILVDRARKWSNDADYILENKFKMQAWQKPKGERNKLRSHLTRTNASIIMCFRTKETAKPERNEKGKIEVMDMGFSAIAGPEFVYEATVSALFMPSSNGVPTWSSDKPGEQRAIKLPGWARPMFKAGKPVTADHGRMLAEWAKGSANVDVDNLLSAANEAAKKGKDNLTAHMAALSAQERSALKDFREKLWKAAVHAESEPAKRDQTPPTPPQEGTSDD